MKNSWNVLVLALGLGFAGPMPDSQSLVLKIGETRRLTLPAHPHIWIQNKNLLQVSNQGRTLLLTGKSEGSTVVNIDNQVYQVQILHPMKKTLASEFAKDLNHSLGLQLKVDEHQITVEGKLYLWQDWLRLAQSSERLKTKYVMRAEISPSLQGRAQEYWQVEMDRMGLAPVPVHFGRTTEARLGVDTETFTKYEKILGPFGVVLEKDKSAVNIAPVVKVQITVAEIRRDFALKYGLEWPQSYSATVMPNNGPTFDDLVFTAHALENRGHGKILASPTLLCRSGKEAEFLAGGEFPIKIINFKMQDVVWKKYGVILKIKPQADSSGRMSIALQTEVSTLDPGHMVDGIPGILSNSVSSHFDLTKPQTIALSGLIKNEESQNVQGLPLLSRLPVLGALFSSRDFVENRSELVIFVRPSIMKETRNLADSQPSLNHLGGLPHDE